MHILPLFTLGRLLGSAACLHEHLDSMRGLGFESSRTAPVAQACEKSQKQLERTAAWASQANGTSCPHLPASVLDAVKSDVSLRPCFHLGATLHHVFLSRAAILVTRGTELGQMRQGVREGGETVKT